MNGQLVAKNISEMDLSLKKIESYAAMCPAEKYSREPKLRWNKTGF